MNPFHSPSPAPVEDASDVLEPRTQPKPNIEQNHTKKPVPTSSPAPLPMPPSYPADTWDAAAENLDAGKSSPAVLALLEDADQNADAGKHGQAVASLERALRIEPKNPLLWHKLSRLRLEEKNWKQAQALAQKSNVLATGNRVLQRENWKIIARAAAALGDKTEAIRAQAMVRQLEVK